MTDPIDEQLESRLGAMEPAQPSEALRERIAASLDVPAPQAPDRPDVLAKIGPVLRPVAWGAVAVLAIGVGIFAVIAFSPVDDEPETAGNAPFITPWHTGPYDAGPDVAAADTPESRPPTAPPTLLALHNAWRESPQAFEKALDRQIAPRSTRSSSQPPPVLTAADARRWDQLEF